MRRNFRKIQADSPESPNAARREFFAGAAMAAAGTIMAGIPMVAAAQTPVSFRFQGAWSARDIFHEYALDYAKRVNDMSGGRLRIEVLPAGAVAKPHELLDAVHKGVLDGCHAAPTFWHGKNAAFSLFGAGPALGMDANNFLAWMEFGGGGELYLELYTRVMSFDVAGFLYGPMPTQPLGWFKRPVASAARFMGLKYRAAGLAMEMFREMGAKVEALPDEEIVPAMERGRIEAAGFYNASSDRALGFPGAAKTCMLQSYHRPAETFEVLFNRGKFDALPADLRAIVRHAAEAASAGMSWKAIHRYSRDHAEMREKEGVRFQRAPAGILRAQMRAWGAVTGRISKENPFFEKVLRSQLAWARRTVGWSQETIVDPRIAYDYWFANKAAPGT